MGGGLGTSAAGRTEQIAVSLLLAVGTSTAPSPPSGMAGEGRVPLTKPRCAEG